QDAEPLGGVLPVDAGGFGAGGAPRLANRDFRHGLPFLFPCASRVVPAIPVRGPPPLDGRATAIGGPDGAIWHSLPAAVYPRKNSDPRHPLATRHFHRFPTGVPRFPGGPPAPRRRTPAAAPRRPARARPPDCRTGTS